MLPCFIGQQEIAVGTIYIYTGLTPSPWPVKFAKPDRERLLPGLLAIIPRGAVLYEREELKPYRLLDQAFRRTRRG